MEPVGNNNNSDYNNNNNDDDDDYPVNSKGDDPRALQWKAAVSDIKKMPAESDSYSNLLVFEGRMSDLDNAQAELMQVSDAVSQSLSHLFETILDTTPTIQEQIHHDGTMLRKGFTMSLTENSKRRLNLLQKLDEKKRMIARFQAHMCYAEDHGVDGEAASNDNHTGEEKSDVSDPDIEADDSVGENEPDWGSLVEKEKSNLSRNNIKVYLYGADALQDADKQIQTFLEETRAGLEESMERLRAVTDQTTAEIAADLNAKRCEIEALMIDNNDRRQRIAQHIQESQGHLSSLLGRVLSTCQTASSSGGAASLLSFFTR